MLAIAYLNLKSNLHFPILSTRNNIADAMNQGLPKFLKVKYEF